MKKHLFFVGFILFSQASHAWISSKWVDFGTYLRSGIGANGQGGDQECFNQPGTPGNEFRLGNECGTYGELALLSYLKRPGEGASEDLYGYGQIRLAYAPDGHTNWEGANGSQPVAVRESFAEIGGLTRYKLAFWAGKRFYRQVDLYMNDFYYFADTSGNGGGILNIPFVSSGKLNLAILRETQSTQSSNGRLAMTLFDVRANNIKIGQFTKLNLWLAHAVSSGGTHTAQAVEYDDPSGQIVGLLFKSGLSGGFNHFAIVWGRGLTDEFNLYGDVTLQKGSPNARAQRNSNRLRVVEHLTYDVTPKWSFHLGSSYELRDNGQVVNSREIWWNVGVHPVYFFDDNFQLAGQLGTSVVDSQGAPARRLTRITLAPQVALSKSIWSRPVLRAFYSRSFWSRSNRGQVGGTVYQNQTSGTSLGLQMEIWF